LVEYLQKSVKVNHNVFGMVALRPYSTKLINNTKL
jgi:hypothetical protein